MCIRGRLQLVTYVWECVGACERVLRAELRPLELELETHSGVYAVLQRTLAQLAEAEARCRAERQSTEDALASVRRLEQKAEESRVEAEQALSDALRDREAREQAEAVSRAAVRRRDPQDATHLPERPALALARRERLA